MRMIATNHSAMIAIAGQAVHYLEHETGRAESPLPRPSLLLLPEERRLLERLPGVRVAVFEQDVGAGRVRRSFHGLADDPRAAWDAVVFGRVFPPLNPGLRREGGVAAAQGVVPEMAPVEGWACVSSLDQPGQLLVVRAYVVRLTPEAGG